MKNKALLAVILSHFKVDREKFIAAAEKEDGDDAVIKEFIDNHQVFKTTDVETLKKNAATKGVEDFFARTDFDVDKDIPSQYHKKILGTNLEKQEKAIAKEYGIETYDGYKDLIKQVIAKSSDGKGKPDQALLEQVETLKKNYAEIQKELEVEKGKYVADEINRTLTTDLNSLPLKYDDDKIENQRDILNTVFNANFKLAKKGETIVVEDLKGVRQVDKLGEPKPVKDVLTEFAKSKGFHFKEADPGGRGSSSSQGASGSSNYKGKTFDEVFKAKNDSLAEGQKMTSPNTEEGIKLFSEWDAANKL